VRKEKRTPFGIVGKDERTSGKKGRSKSDEGKGEREKRSAVPLAIWGKWLLLLPGRKKEGKGTNKKRQQWVSKEKGGGGKGKVLPSTEEKKEGTAARVLLFRKKKGEGKWRAVPRREEEGKGEEEGKPILT